MDLDPGSRKDGVRLLGLPGEHQRVPARKADRAARDKAPDGKPQRLEGGIEAYLCGNPPGCPEAGGIGHDGAGVAGLEPGSGDDYDSRTGAGQRHGAQKIGLHEHAQAAEAPAIPERGLVQHREELLIHYLRGEAGHKQDACLWS